MLRLRAFCGMSPRERELAFLRFGILKNDFDSGFSDARRGRRVPSKVSIGFSSSTRSRLVLVDPIIGICTSDDGRFDEEPFPSSCFLRVKKPENLGRAASLMEGEHVPQGISQSVYPKRSSCQGWSWFQYAMSRGTWAIDAMSDSELLPKLELQLLRKSTCALCVQCKS